MRLLLLPSVIGEQLRSGYDVIAVTEREDLRSASDQALFERARGEGRVIVTENIEDFR